MSRLSVALLVGAALVTAAGACYKDDSTGNHGKPMAKVLLTDAPFPYDSVASVNVYVVRIAASTGADTTGGVNWTVIAEPRKRSNPLNAQRATPACVRDADLPAG